MAGQPANGPRIAVGDGVHLGLVERRHDGAELAQRVVERPQLVHGSAAFRVASCYSPVAGEPSSQTVAGSCAATSSAICTALRAAPLRRLSLLMNSASP